MRVSLASLLAFPVLVFSAGAGGEASRAVNVRDFGAKGDGKADDTAAVRAAAQAASGGTLTFAPGATYKLTGTISIAARTHVVGTGAVVRMAVATDDAEGRLFYIAGDDVEIDGLSIEGEGQDAKTSGNKYAITIGGSKDKHLKNVHLKNCRIAHLPWADVKKVISSHAVYNRYADGTTMENCVVDGVSGAAFYGSVSTGLRILNNDINDTGWYSIQFNDGVDGAVVAGNRITGTCAGCRNWGGSVNLMSNSTTGGRLGTGNARIKSIDIIGNYISGTHSYTAAVQIESSSYVSFTNNLMESISLSNGSPPTYVRVYTRPIGPQSDEGPCDHIDVSHNMLVAKGMNCIAVYADNQRYGGQRGAAEALTIRDNVVVTPDDRNTFSHAAIVHGQAGGWKDVAIGGNRARGIPLSTPVPGMIGIFGSPSGPVENVLITDNSLEQAGTARDSSSVGIAIGDFVSACFLDRNDVRGFWNGLRTFPKSSPIELGTKNVFAGVSSSTVFAVAPKAKPAPAVERAVPATGSRLKSGVKTSMGMASLIAGKATVSNPGVAGSTRIFVASLGGARSIGVLRVSKTPGTGFTISSSNSGDAVAVAWLAVDTGP